MARGSWLVAVAEPWLVAAAIAVARGRHGRQTVARARRLGSWLEAVALVKLPATGLDFVALPLAEPFGNDGPKSSRPCELITWCAALLSPRLFRAEIILASTLPPRSVLAWATSRRLEAACVSIVARPLRSFSPRSRLADFDVWSLLSTVPFTA